MVYSTLVSRLADPEGEQTRTPLGVFTIVRRKQKAVRTPDGKWSSAPERIQAKLKPGKKLQREVPKEEALSGTSSPGQIPAPPAFGESVDPTP
jgi:hypothetical protein